MTSMPGRNRRVRPKKKWLLFRLPPLFEKSREPMPPHSPPAKHPTTSPRTVDLAPERLAGSDGTSMSKSALHNLCAPAKHAATFIILLSIRETEAKTTRHLMRRIATRLWVLSVALDLSTHTATNNNNIEEDAADALIQIRKIFLRRDPGNIDYKHMADQIVSRIRGDFDRRNVESSVVNYFKSSLSVPTTNGHSDVDNLDELCHGLISRMTGGWECTADLPTGIKTPEPNDYPNSANKKLFEALISYTLCNHLCCPLRQDHREHDSDSCLEKNNKRHPTRLPLGGPLQVSRDQEGYTTFDIVISSFPDTSRTQFRDISWTQFQVGVSSREVKFARADTDIPEPQREQHILCSALPELGQSQVVELKYVPGTGLVQTSPFPQPARGLYRDQGLPLLEAIRTYTFSVRDKIVLAHTVAQAFWQLYASDLMRCVWTSDNILFMHEDDDGNARNELPMKAYLCFDFVQDPQRVPEFLDPSQHTYSHRFPHILALGILLLEICIGSAVRDSEFTDLNHITPNHIKAHNKWQDLKKVEWDGFKLHMDHLINVIGHCLDSKRIWQYSSPPSAVSQAAITTRAASGNSSTARDPETLATLGARRDWLYDKVVKPLAWLAAAFHEDSENITYPYKEKTYLVPCPVDERNRPSANLEQKKVLFTHNHQDGQWLDDFKTINGHLRGLVEARKRQLDQARSNTSYSAIKVAILDTGYNPQLEFFRRDGRQNQIKWKDFVAGESHGVDDDGHGSFMTKLVMETAPLAEIYVVRVGKSSQDLEKETITEAILWTGLDKDVRADVISMSFAFEAEFEDVKEISDAIERVRKERDSKVIFLAAAGNFGVNQPDMFPAKHRDVIPIHATDGNGKFLVTDPEPTGQQREFGTFGGDLPGYFTRDISNVYPGLDMRPGSSIATAVAAGVVANTLTHADLLPHLNPPLLGLNIPLQRLRMKPGMERTLKLMVKGNTVDHGRLFFNPVWLWTSRQTPESSIDFNIGIALQATLMDGSFP